MSDAYKFGVMVKRAFGPAPVSAPAPASAGLVGAEAPSAGWDSQRMQRIAQASRMLGFKPGMTDDELYQRMVAQQQSQPNSAISRALAQQFPNGLPIPGTPGLGGMGAPSSAESEPFSLDMPPAPPVPSQNPVIPESSAAQAGAQMATSQPAPRGPVPNVTRPTSLPPTAKPLTMTSNGGPGAVSTAKLPTLDSIGLGPATKAPAPGGILKSRAAPPPGPTNQASAAATAVKPNLSMFNSFK
jgi:hypothetical protein